MLCPSSFERLTLTLTRFERVPKGTVWRVHTAFDLLAGRLTQFKVTDQSEAERLEVFDLQPGDVVVTDRANGLRTRIVFVLIIDGSHHRSD